MMRTMAVLVLVCIPLEIRANPQSYSPKHRAQIVEKSLRALRNTALDELRSWQGRVDRISAGLCDSPFHARNTRCLLKQAGRFCGVESSLQQERCALVMDILLTNKLSEQRFLDRRARYVLMEQSNFRAAMRKQLEFRYAQWVIGLSMSIEFSKHVPLPVRIDRYCERAGRDERLSWQRCVAATVWYIGTRDLKGTK